MTAFIIDSAESLQKHIGDLREDWNHHKYLRGSYRTGKDRSTDFNALSHVWYNQIARELREDDALGWKSFSKLHFAVPIMRAEDLEFKAFYDLAIKGLTYEQKLQAMAHINVSSLMTNIQFKAFCEAMQAHFLKQGVMLEFPPEDAPKKVRRAA